MFWKRKSTTGLNKQVLRWSWADFFRKADLVRSTCVQGASGSGKTNFVGWHMANALVADRDIGGVILASKAVEDGAFWQEVFAKAGRKDDLLVFGPEHDLRFNALDYELKQGADSRELANFLMVVGETLKRSDGDTHQGDRFFRDQSERMLEMAIEPVRLATGKLSPVDLQRFITGAAISPDQMKTPEWRAGFHCQVLEGAYKANKTPIEQADFERVADYWLAEIPALNDRTKSSITTQVQGILHILAGGILCSLLGGETNVTPGISDSGKWVLVDMPVSRYGASGAMVNGVWHLATQRHILRRHAADKNKVTVLWIDEFQNHLNSFDAQFLAECRSHGGCMVVLTQSLHSYFAALKGGQAAEHQANSLLTNFATKIFCCLGDEKSARWASDLLGDRREVMIGGSMAPEDSAWDILTGNSKFSGSFSEAYQPVVRPGTFMHGLRTGAGGVADAIIIRAEAFSNGQNHLLVSFRR
jgi:hypothetical protein